VRGEILAAVREYHALAFAEEPFEAGVSRVQYAGRVFDAEELVELVDASLEFWLTSGRFTRRFEDGLASYLGVAHCSLVNSGSAANLLAFMALTSPRLGERRVRRGDEVITVAASFPTTIAPLVQFGAVPVFVDVRPDTANADVTLLEGALSARTKAVVLAHTLGNPFPAREVKELCERHDLWLIEDNCDALGSRYGGRLTGTFGDIATSSFYPPHHITMGEGGAVYTDDHVLADIVRALRDWGRDCSCPPGVDGSCGRRFSGDFGRLPHGYDHKYVYGEFGYNCKATDLQAAVGCAQLVKLPSFVAARRRNHRLLLDMLRPVADVLEPMRATPGSEPSWFGLLLTVREGSGLRRDDLVRGLEERRIQTRMLFGGNMIRQPCFDALRATGEGYRVAGELAATDRIMRDAFWVGVYPGLGEEALAHLGEALVEAALAKAEA
jgi:CDP-6-deoxy-D-xylo-4-hexulose-3-dehydrase